MTVFSQYLENYDGLKLSIAGIILIIRCTKVLRDQNIRRLQVRVIALKRQTIMYLAVFSQYLENYKRFS